MPFAASVPMEFAGGRRSSAGVPGSKGGLERGPSLAARIAIVEDELMVAWSLEAMVEDLGCDVTGIYSRGAAALAGIEGPATDIVLMDINLGGGIDGIETARRLRAAHDVAIIFISAYSDPETRARIAAEVPGAPLLRKPVSLDLLEQSLRDAAAKPN